MKLEPQSRDRLWDRLWRQGCDQLDTPLLDQINDQLWNQIGGQLRVQIDGRRWERRRQLEKNDET